MRKQVRLNSQPFWKTKSKILPSNQISTLADIHYTYYDQAMPNLGREKVGQMPVQPQQAIQAPQPPAQSQWGKALKVYGGVSAAGLVLALLLAALGD
jgi:hypothetical protein